ncbi:MAG: hypothetical protein OXI86_22180, partial [Candidatus Poribacteria bacterium]|nr:hypothetical protein [Candidatus Poribacteria bacterium]
SNQRWIVGGKLCLLHNHLNTSLMESVTRWLFFADEGFAKADWFPTNLRLCRRGEWNSRMLVETTLSMLTLDFKKVMHRRWSFFKTRVGFTMALFNLLVQWDGVSIHENGIVHLSIAQFSL